MAVTETYVDPAIAADSGAGTIGDPYGDLQFALNTMTRDATNGDRLNIKAGTAEFLTSGIDLTSYGTPAIRQPLVLQGYTSVSDDGGVAEIDANANGPVFESLTVDYISFIDLILTNSGSSNVIVRVDRFCFFFNCQFTDGSSAPLLRVGNNSRVESCYFTNGSDAAIQAGSGMEVINCVFRNGATDFTDMLIVLTGSEVINNIFIADGATNGISLQGDVTTIRNNSIFSVSGTGTGIEVLSANDKSVILNNIIEGFSGIGGVAILSNGLIFTYGNNKFFNNTVNKGSGDIIRDIGNNDTLTASPFVDAANDDFRVNTLPVRASAYPAVNFPDLSVRTFLDIGALQRQEGASIIAPSIVGVSLGQLYNVPAEDRIYEVLP